MSTTPNVAAGLLDDQALPLATDLILQFGPALPAQPQALAMLDALVGEVRPAVAQQLKPAIPI